MPSRLGASAATSAPAIGNPHGPPPPSPRYLLLRTHQLSLDAFLVALKFMRVEDVDIDEVQCILANLIYMVSEPRPSGLGLELGVRVELRESHLVCDGIF